jgi:agmatinase
MTESYIPKWPRFTFCGIENPPMEDSEVIMVPVPFDSTQSYRTGSRNGPESVIDASRYMELYDHQLGWSPVDVGIHTHPGVEPVRGDAERTLKRVEGVVSALLSEGKFPVVVGGEHTISVGCVSAAKRIWEDLSVICLDAHCDLRDQFEGSRFSHACTSRRILDLTPDLAILGPRSCSEEEWDFIQERGVNVSFWREGDAGYMVREIERVTETQKGPVYLSVDLDVLNPSDLPAVGTPEPLGPSYGDMVKILKRAVEALDIVGVDFVELTPIPGDTRSQFLAAKLIYKLIGLRFQPHSAHSRG